MAFLLVLAAAELVWRFAGPRFDALNAIGTQLVSRLHPDIPSTDSAEIASDYSHAMWLLVAVALAGVVSYFAKAARIADMSATSRRVGWLPAALVVAGVLLLLTSEAVMTPIRRTLQAYDERDRVRGDPVLALVGRCHDAIRKHFAGKPMVTIDSGVDPARAYIYTYQVDRAPGLHFVRVARSRSEVTVSTTAPPPPPLTPPIQGGYIVEGLVLYSGDDPAVSWSDHREYHCSMLVTGDRYEVRDLRFNMVR